MNIYHTVYILIQNGYKYCVFGLLSMEFNCVVFITNKINKK